MSSEVLRRALTGPCDGLALRPLPERVAVLLEALGASPRLAAHLRVVHDVACQLADWVEQHHRAVTFDRSAMLFGVATHDIGKINHLDELSGPGSAHEQAGMPLLMAHGVEERLARFSSTHAAWGTANVATHAMIHKF